MALFDDYNPQNVEQVLKKQADSASANIADTGAQGRKRLVAKEAASGRLMSGVADYPLADYDTGVTSQLSGVQDQLANALGAIPSEDYLNSAQFKRQMDLAKYVGSLMQPSTLDEIFQGIGSAGKIGSTVAAFGGG